MTYKILLLSITALTVFLSQESNAQTLPPPVGTVITKIEAVANQTESKVLALAVTVKNEAGQEITYIENIPLVVATKSQVKALADRGVVLIDNEVTNVDNKYLVPTSVAAFNLIVNDENAFFNGNNGSGQSLVPECVVIPVSQSVANQTGLITPKNVTARLCTVSLDELVGPTASERLGYDPISVFDDGGSLALESALLGSSTSLEPSVTSTTNASYSPGERKIALIYSCYYYDDTGEHEEDNCPATLKFKVIPDSGSHDSSHDQTATSRPRGRIDLTSGVDTGDSAGEVEAPQNGDDAELDTNTGPSSNSVGFNYVAPEASGTTEIDAIGLAGNASNPYQQTLTVMLDVKIQNLISRSSYGSQGGGQWVNNGIAPCHFGDNSNAQSGVLTRMDEAADLWDIAYTVIADYSPPIQLSDISLPWGGVYDVTAKGSICGSYLPPHKTHRRGEAADVRLKVGQRPMSRLEYTALADSLVLAGFVFGKGEGIADCTAATANACKTDHFHVIAPQDAPGDQDDSSSS